MQTPGRSIDTMQHCNILFGRHRKGSLSLIHMYTVNIHYFCLDCDLIITRCCLCWCPVQEMCVILNSMDCTAERIQLNQSDMRGIHWQQTSQFLPQTFSFFLFSSSDLHSDLDLLFTMVAELISINCGICICGNSHKASCIRGLRNHQQKNIMQQHCDLPNVLHLKMNCHTVK